MLCVGGAFVVNYNTDTAAPTNVFTVQLSDAAGNFSLPTVIGSYNVPAPSGYIQCTIPSTMTPGTGYRIRIVQSAPYFVSPDNGKNIRISTYPSINTMTSNSPVCEGTALTMNATATSGVSFSWAGPNSFASSIQNPSINNPDTNAKGKYILTVTRYGCSVKDSMNLMVVQTPTKPVIVGTNPVCVGEFLSFSAVSTAGVNFEWTGPNGFYLNGQQGTIGIQNVKAIHAGLYTVRAYATGCSASESVTAVLKPRPDSAAATNNGPVCEGDTIKLSATCTTPGVTYTWAGPNGFTSTQQNPVIYAATFAADGLYKVNSILNGCLSVDGPTTVSVGVPLIAPTVVSNAPLCPGDSLRMIASATVSIGTFTWTGPNGFSYTGKSPVINPVSNANEGTYSVTLSHNGCTSVAGTVFVKIPFVPKPVPSTNSPVCEGGELKLMCASLPSDAFKWLGPNGFTAHSKDTTITNITKLQAGEYTVYNIKDNCSASSIISVEVNPIPDVANVSSNSPVCEGSPLKLSASSSVAGTSFVWRGPGGYNATGQYPQYNIPLMGAGTYYVRANAKGCLSAEDSTTVEVKEKPVLPVASSNSPLKEGDILKLSADCETQNVSFKWTGPNDFTSTEQNPTIPNITTLETGSYIISAATPFGCVSSSVTIVLVQAGKTTVYVVFPNPNNGIFTIKGRTNTDQTIPFEILNTAGAAVYKDKIPTNKKILNQQITLPVELPTGEYFLRLSADGKLYTNRFTVAR